MLVFGQVDAKIVELAEGLWGVVLHPSASFQVSGSLDEAKAAAEESLKATLTAALDQLQ